MGYYQLHIHSLVLSTFFGKLGIYLFFKGRLAYDTPQGSIAVANMDEMELAMTPYKSCSMPLASRWR